MQVAIENGCNLITHLYSCTSTITRDHGFRSLGVIESAYLRDELYVEIIADGKHLPPDLIKLIIKIKGTDKVVLITDSLEIAGTDITEGVMSGTEFIVEDGVCKLKDRTAFAGSVATADRLIQTLVDDCGYSIPMAVKMLTEVPAKILNVNKGFHNFMIICSRSSAPTTTVYKKHCDVFRDFLRFKHVEHSPHLKWFI